MSVALTIVVNVALMLALIAGLVYVMRRPYHLPSPPTGPQPVHSPRDREARTRPSATGLQRRLGRAF